MFIIRHIKLFLGIAVAVVVLSLGSLAYFGFPLGIDFTGGALTEISYDERPDKEALEVGVAELDLGGFSLRQAQSEGGNPAYILRTRDLSEAERQEVFDVVVALGTGGEVERFTSIGPVIGQELKDKAVWAIGTVMLIIVLYVAFAFRGVSRPIRSWYYGLIAILVLVHDVLIPTALVSVFAPLTGIEVDVLFVMAILAVLGYSINDTLVIFDRIRENILKNKEAEIEEPFAQTVGNSLSQTFVRSVNTSLTTLLALGALYVLGGGTTQNFAFILIAGVVAGTYSSLFIAPPLLVVLEKHLTKKRLKKEAQEEREKPAEANEAPQT